MWVEHSFGGTPLWTSAPPKDLWSLWWCRWTLFQKRTGPTESQYPIRYCTPWDRSCPPPPSPSHRALIMTNKSLLWTCFIMDHCWYLQHVLADLWVSKVTENGLSDHQYFCRTHLGHLLSPGDTVYGCVRTVSLYYWVIDIIYTRINNFIKHGEAIQYFTFGFINFIVHCTSVLHVQFCNTLYFHRFDFTNANLNNPDLEKVKAEKLPDVVSIRPWCMIISMQNKYLDINSH